MQGKLNTPERMMDSVTKTSTCWLWTGIVNRKGYGKFRIAGKFLGTHRVAYALFKEPIPKGMWVLHTCDVPNCVNPDHLYIGDQYDNERDKVARGRHHHAIKTHCPQQHPYAGDNLIVEFKINGKTSRRCRMCKNKRQRKST